MKKLIICLFVLTIFSCKDSVNKDDYSLLNGYWEIETVTLADGKTKEYKVNLWVDYFEIKDAKGFKKKMKVKLDGSYTTNDDAESFTLETENNKTQIHYKNNLSEWTEELTYLSKNSFTIKNKDGFVYTYKRYQALNLQ